jgi:hypothetical protein
MSWAYKVTFITLGFVCFMTFMVVAAFRESFDLVTEDYYGEELKFQSQIDKQINQQQLQGSLTLEQHDDSLFFSFPQEFKDKLIAGELLLFRPSDASKDRKIKWNAKSLTLAYPKKELISGLYSVKMDYAVDGKLYYYQRDIVIR